MENAENKENRSIFIYDNWNEKVQLGTPAGQSSGKRISRKQLLALRDRLSNKHLSILTAIRKFRFMTTDQVKRLYFLTGTTDNANLRAASRTLKKLREAGLISPLDRRIGGTHAGSSALIWHLTEPGERLLNLDHPAKHRKRFEELLWTTVLHTLAVTDLAINILLFTQEDELLAVERLEVQPESHRPYTRDYKRKTLKPDLYVVLKNDNKTIRQYIEVDSGTRYIPQMEQKCLSYIEYYHSFEGDLHDLDPAVTFVMSDYQRLVSLEETLDRHHWSREENRLFRFLVNEERIAWEFFFEDWPE